WVSVSRCFYSKISLLKLCPGRPDFLRGIAFAALQREHELGKFVSLSKEAGYVQAHSHSHGWLKAFNRGPSCRHALGERARRTGHCAVRDAGLQRHDLRS